MGHTERRVHRPVLALIRFSAPVGVNLITAHTVAMRFAGQWEPPPALFRDIARWMSAVYASHILSLVEDAIEALHLASTWRVTYERLLEAQAGFENTIRTLAPGKRYSIEPTEYKWPYPVVERVKDGSYQMGWARRGTKTYLVEAPLERVLHTVAKWLPDQIQTAERKTEWLTRYTGVPGDREKRLVTLQLLRRECLKYTDTARWRANRVSETFTIDLTGWRYLTREQQEAGPNEWFRWVKATMVFRGQNDQWTGHWRFLDKDLEVDVPSAENKQAPSLEQFRARLNGMLGTLYHECQHVGQDLLAGWHKNKEEGGLPSRYIRNPDVKPDGSPRIDKRPPTLRYVDRRVDHHLRDVEFYPNLGDDTRALTREIQRIHPQRRLDFFKLYTGQIETMPDLPSNVSRKPSYRLVRLKTEAPAKWQKLVSELYKAVEPYL